MLDDMIRKAALTGVYPVSGRKMPPGGVEPYRVVAKKLADAHHFSFDEDIVRAAFQLGYTKPSALLAALPLVRFPYRRTWFQFEEKMMADMASDLGQPGGGSQYSHLWSGILIDCDDSLRAGTMYFCTNDVDMDPSISPVCAHFDFRTPGSMASVGQNPLWTHDEIRQILASNPLTRIWAKDEREVAAYEKLVTTTHNDIADFSKPMIAMLRKIHGPRWEQENLPDAIENARNMFNMGRAIVCLMNARNLTAAPEPEGEATPALRAMRSKHRIPPAFSRSVVRMGLSKAARNIGERSGMSEGEIRAHMVRGHFKIRARKDGTSGIYWWSPHLRGTLKHGYVDKSYEVSGADGEDALEAAQSVPGRQ